MADTTADTQPHGATGRHLHRQFWPGWVAYLAWNEGVRRVGPGKATAFYNMLPVYGTLLGVFFPEWFVRAAAIDRRRPDYWR